MISIQDYLKGKKVALVAPGKSLEGKGQGSFIDSFDVVVRINRALSLSKELSKDLGSRTDILYNCLDFCPEAGGPIDPKTWLDLGVKYVCSTYPKSEFFTRPELSNGLDKYIPTRWMPDEVYYPIRRGIKGRPNSGTTSLVDLLSFDIKSVRLFGIDFFRTLYIDEYSKKATRRSDFEKFLKTNPSDRHDPDSQYLFFKNTLYKNDNRIEVDDYFKEIIKDPNFDNMYFKGE
jgi:hypothetical protein